MRRVEYHIQRNNFHILGRVGKCHWFTLERGGIISFGKTIHLYPLPYSIEGERKIRDTLLPEKLRAAKRNKEIIFLLQFTTRFTGIIIRCGGSRSTFAPSFWFFFFFFFPPFSYNLVFSFLIRFPANPLSTKTRTLGITLALLTGKISTLTLIFIFTFLLFYFVLFVSIIFRRNIYFFFYFYVLYSSWDPRIDNPTVLCVIQFDWLTKKHFFIFYWKRRKRLRFPSSKFYKLFSTDS